MQLTPDRLQNTIFIDFECLATAPPHPALLGVLMGAEGEDFEQVIIDSRLVPARVARRDSTRVEAAADAARAVVARAVVNDWSSRLAPSTSGGKSWSVSARWDEIRAETFSASRMLALGQMYGLGADEVR